MSDIACTIRFDNDSIITDGTFPEGLGDVSVIPKSNEQPSEDVIALTARHVAVFDGMSSPLRPVGVSPSGRSFALAAARAVLELPSGIDATGAVDALTRAVAGIDGRHVGPQGTVGAILSLELRQVWRVGDVHVRIGDDDHLGHKEVDRAFTDFRAAINQAVLRGGGTLDQIIRDDPGLRAAAPLLKAQPMFANSPGPWGYGVFDGSRVPVDFIEVMHVPPGAAVVITTDGYPMPRARLADANKVLRDAIARDPACIGELREMAKPMRPGFNAPDDRSFVQLTVKENRE